MGSTGPSALIGGGDPSLAAEIEALLSESGYEVTSVDGDAQVTDALASRSFAAVLLTGRMYGRSWPKSLSAVQEMAPGTAVLALTRIHRRRASG